MSKILDLVRTTEIQRLAELRDKLKREPIPQINPGDTLRVHARVVEGNKERTQVFEGTVIRVRQGTLNASVTVRRISHQVGVERTFLLHSPRVERFEVTRRGDVRRAALYYLRERTGKATRIKEKRPPQASAAQKAAQAAAKQASGAAAQG